MHQLPNLLSLLRLLMSVPIALLLLEERYDSVLLLFVVAAFSDALDGFLARRFGWISRLGSILDPLADKVLLVTSYVCLTLISVLPWWLTLLVLLRDLLIVGGALLYRLLAGPLAFRPSRLGKFSTLLQLVLVIAVLLESSILPAFADVHGPLVLLVSLCTFASGAHYIWNWTRKFRAARQGA